MVLAFQSVQQFGTEENTPAQPGTPAPGERPVSQQEPRAEAAPAAALAVVPEAAAPSPADPEAPAVLAASAPAAAATGAVDAAVTAAAGVVSGSMVPALAPGSLVINEGVDTARVCDTIGPGDVVTYTMNGAGQVTHRVTEILPATDREGPACRLTVQGDANAQPDAAVAPEQLRGVMLYAVPVLGWLWAGFGPVGAAALMLLPAIALACTGWLLGRRRDDPAQIDWAAERDSTPAPAPRPRRVPRAARDAGRPAAETVTVRDEETEAAVSRKPRVHAHAAPSRTTPRRTLGPVSVPGCGGCW
ncbi:signal peptidase I [Leucobacter massiliensis]|uniref:Signal peptidase I n=1 Tax=Leucobacter massiliensis TaxID=1686285 RepID=A0A2S9QPS4_9MICO|nr:signal peptidase I [Leucobacter massiliensis]